MRRPDLILIASSLGGVDALRKIIPKLNGIKVPVLVVQHMGISSMSKEFTNALDSMSTMRVVEADNGMDLIPGKVYVAKGGYHMQLNKKGAMPKIEINLEPKVNFVRPAADKLFADVANNYRGKNILVFIGTGMGRDGLEGVRILKKCCNCYCLTESEKDCAVYGMPKEVCNAGLSDEVLRLNYIASRINLISENGWE